jgi:branched-chain amino acid aminotransferase
VAGQAFDDRDGLIWMDGQLVPWRDAKAHVLTHAMHYGSAVFEGERAYGGAVFKSSKHSERLRESGRILDFDVPYSSSKRTALRTPMCARSRGAARR